MKKTANHKTRTFSLIWIWLLMLVGVQAAETEPLLMYSYAHGATIYLEDDYGVMLVNAGDTNQPRAGFVFADDQTGEIIRTTQLESFAKKMQGLPAEARLTLYDACTESLAAGLSAREVALFYQTIADAGAKFSEEKKTICHCEHFKRQKTGNEMCNGVVQQGTRNKMIKITMTTNRGDINLNIFAGQTPQTASNFLNLAKRGYYDGLKFHRVIDEFMVQGGDPTGTGRGGPGYNFDDEIVASLRHDRPGILSMANSGPGTNGSQFFITHVATPWLDGKHTVFGAVVADADMKVVNSIKQNDTIKKITIHDSTDELFTANEKFIARANAKLDAAK